MGDSQQSEHEVLAVPTDLEESKTASESSPSDDENERDRVEKATDPGGDMASDGGEQPL
jgi:hypothetical protein